LQRIIEGESIVSAILCEAFVSSSFITLSTELFVVAELEAVDETLKEFEDEDEMILAQRDKFKNKSSTRSRPKQTINLPDANKVESFVTARQEWVVKEKKVSSSRFFCRPESCSLTRQ